MNRHYRSIWNEVSRTFVAVAEKVHAKGKPASGPSSQAAGAEQAVAAAAVPARTRVMPRALEQRFMFDAAAVSTAIDAVTDHVVGDVQADSGLSAALDKVVQAVALQQEASRVQEPVLLREADTAASGGRNEIAFVDSRVADYQTLVAGIGAGIEVRLIDGSQDGLAQLAAWAASHSGYDAIHILSHGSSGLLALGTTKLDLNTLDAQSDALGQLGNALTSDGDILLYGCNIADGEAGTQFLNRLAALTRADIAASDDKTGAAELAADWVLESRVGEVESSLKINADNWHDVMGTDFLNIYTSAVAAATDANNNTYLAGNLQNVTFDFGGQSLTFGESRGVWLAKYDYNNNLVWVKQWNSLKANSAYGDNARALAVDANGGVYLSMSVMGAGNGGSSNVGNDTFDADPGAGVSNVTTTSFNGAGMLVKLNASGDFQWSRQTGVSGDGGRIAIDSSNNVYYLGTYRDNASFGGVALGSGGSGTHHFIIKMNEAGSVLWTRTAFAGNDVNAFSDVTVDSTGKVYIAGYNGYSLTIDGVNYTTVWGQNSDYDGLLWALNSDGTTNYVRKISGSANERYTNVEVLADGNLLLSGVYQSGADLDPSAGSTVPSNAGANDFFLTKISQTGSLIWSITTGGSGADTAKRLFQATDGSIIVTGTFNNTITLGSYSLTSAGSTDAFIAKITNDGQVAWAYRLGSSRADDIIDVKALSGTQFRVIATIRDTTDVDPGAGVVNATTSASNTPGVVAYTLDLSGVFATTASASDTTPPVFDVAPAASNVSTSTLTLSASIDEAGTLYYVVVPDGSPAPTAAQVKAGQNGSGGSAVTSGNSAVASSPFTGSFNVSGLSAGTAYDIYVVAQDDEGTPNLMASPVKVDVTMSAPANNNPTISDVSNQTLSEGGATSALAVTIGDTETAASALTLTGSSNNTTLIPNGNIFISGSGANRTVTITPAANQTGTATITLTVDDGNGGTATDTFTVTVNDVDPVISNATVSLDENTASGTTVTTVTASGDTDGLVYSITGGTGSSLFDINSSTGVITVKSGAVLDYETASQYTLTVAVDDEDAGSTADSTATITINLNDLNEAPTNISLSSSTLGLSQMAANATIGSLSATDQDSGAIQTYSLVAGSGDTHNGSFVIVGNTLKVGSNALAAGTYLVRVQATDNGGLSYQKALTVTVSDDIAPTLDAANSTPADNALQIAPSANIVLLFSESLQAGTGTLVLRNLTTNQVVETFNIATGTGTAGGTVSISGNTVTLNPGSNLAEATRYSVRIDGTALRDTAANAFAGISDDSSFNFTTGVSDSAAPLIQSIQRQTPSGEATNAASLVYTVHFNEAVAAADVNDFVLTSTGTASGTISSVSGSGTDTLTVTVTGVSGTGTLGLSLGNSQNITDIAGNALATAEPADDEVYTVDRDVPTLVSINRVGDEQSQGGSLQFLVVFSEPVSSVDAADFALLLGGTASGTISSISGTGTPVLTVTVSNASGSGSLGLGLANGYSISDASGNSLASSTPDTGISEYYTVDSVAPTVTSITRTADTLTTADSVSFDVSFSEGVNNVGLSDFSLTTSGNVAGTISAISGSNGHYRVTVSGISGSGTLGLAFAGSQDVADDSGNALTATTPTLDETYTIDNTAPTVSAINRAGVNQIVAGTSTDAVFTVVFSEVVSGVSAADFTVTGTAANTGISSVSSSDGKTFHVTVGGVNGSSGQTVGLNFTGTVSDRVGQDGNTAFSAGQVYTVGNLLLNEGAIDQATLDGLLGVNRDGVQKLVSSSTTVTQVIIIDSRLPGLAQQLSNLAAGTEVWLLDGKSSATAQITQILAQYHNLAAVHLLSHGSEGALYLGAETLSAANLAAQHAALAGWGAALSANGDFLLYGCDVAKGTTGTEFINAFAAATQADVAASTDLTGASWLGGDWVLEQTAGSVDADVLAMCSYESALGATTTMDMANGTLDAGFVYVRPNGTSNTWVFGNGWFRMNGYPDESLPIVSVALGTISGIPSGSSVQYSTNGGGGVD